MVSFIGLYDYEYCDTNEWIGSVCSAEYKEPKNPIIIPITHIIA